MQARQPVLPAEAVRRMLLPALKTLRSEAMHVSGLFLHSQPLTCSCESFRVVYLDIRPLILSLPIFKLSLTMAPRIPCTCGCGQQVTYPTKRNHLKGHAVTSLRARVLGIESSGRQQQESTPRQNQPRGSKKRASSNHDQDGSRKRLRQLNQRRMNGMRLPLLSKSTQIQWILSLLKGQVQVS